VLALLPLIPLAVLIYMVAAPQFPEYWETKESSLRRPSDISCTDVLGVSTAHQ